MRNFAAQNVADAFREMEAVAMGTLCKNFFYHANVNPRDDELLLWVEAMDCWPIRLRGETPEIGIRMALGASSLEVSWLLVASRLPCA